MMPPDEMCKPRTSIQTKMLMMHMSFLKRASFVMQPFLYKILQKLKHQCQKMLA